MVLELMDSDVVILSVAAAALTAAVLMEMLRVVIPDIYEWLADYRKVRQEIRETEQALNRLLTANMEQAALRDRRNAERFRLKSNFSRIEMQLQTLERDRTEFWHELGEQSLGENLYTARVLHRGFADLSTRDFDSAPVIWRHTNNVRIWAPSDRQARQRLMTAFPSEAGYSTSEVTLVAAAAAVPPTPPVPTAHSGSHARSGDRGRR